MMPLGPESFLFFTVSVISELQHPHEAGIVASLCSIAGIPSASQMQFAHHDRPPACTGKAVGTAEKGAARQSSPFSCNTNAWVWANRLSPAFTRSEGTLRAAAICATRGAV